MVKLMPGDKVISPDGRVSKWTGCEMRLVGRLPGWPESGLTSADLIASLEQPAHIRGRIYPRHFGAVGPLRVEGNWR